jgi:hypothetical protein
MSQTTASHVRAELLGEHFKLRDLIEEARTLLAKSDASEALRGCAERLADALFFHARHEEQAARGVLAPIHARHPEHYAIMDDAHVAEHARLVTVLRGLRAADEPTRRARITEVVTELETHMAEEEAILLADDV